jgi:tRNA A-37 threonylcarbamoyl transferase component Bud32/tetratricopeptide (TPR) repeat protein
MRCVNEQTVQDLLVGRLRGDALGRVEHHLAECSSCAALVVVAGQEVADSASPSPIDQQPSPVPASLGQGTMVGRYVVLGLLGTGGMGEVHAAYDPNLERKVAIKFLRPDRFGRHENEIAAERMRREARLLAKLSHPNVVVVYETGVFDDRLFIAMEHVDGQSVSEWLRTGRRSIAEILRVFLAAGAGLGAAHAGGVIHRDFKPHNVMLSRTGEVRVMDFGLAHLEGEAGLPEVHPTEIDAGPVEDTVEIDARLTRTGTLLGTPAYMAPEQLRGDRASARADQYSFCVALHEAVFGWRPTGPRIATPGVRGTVPAWLRRILKRGLAEEPEQRYPSMEALLADLAANRTRHRVVFGAVALGLLAAAGVGVAVANRSARRVLFCGGYEARAVAVWPFRDVAAGRIGRGAPQAISQAFARSGVTGAGEIFDRVGRTLSTYLEKWSDLATDACEATHVRGEQSREELSLRLGCLDERLAAAHALTGALARADAKVVEHAAEAAADLPDLGRCSQLGLLRAATKPPEGAAKNEAVAQLRRRMDELKLLAGTGHFESVAGDLRALERDIHAVDYPPLLADFDLLVLTHLWANVGSPESQLERMREAIRAAASSGYEEGVAGALVGLVGVQYRNAQLADLAYDQADAVLQHLGDPSELRGWLETNESITLYARGRLRDALEHGQRSLALKRRHTPLDERDLASSESNVCLYLHVAGKTAAALPVCERAVKLFASGVGWGHPQTMNAVENKADVLTDLGRFEEGCALAERVQSFFRGIGEPTEGRTVLALALGRCALGGHRPEVARDYFQRALAVATSSNATELEVADIERHLARAWLASGDDARAAEFTERAARRYEKLPELAFRIPEMRAALIRRASP